MVRAIEGFYDKTAAILRKVEGEDYDGNYQAEEEEVCEFSCHIQQAAPEMAQYIGASLAKTYSIWCDPLIDVREGDRLQIAADFYTVRAIQKNLVGANKHQELIVLHGGLSG